MNNLSTKLTKVVSDLKKMYNFQEAIKSQCDEIAAIISPYKAGDKVISLSSVYKGKEVVVDKVVLQINFELFDEKPSYKLKVFATPRKADGTPVKAQAVWDDMADSKLKSAIAKLNGNE